MTNKKDKLNEQFKKVSSKDTTLAEEIVQTNKNRKKMLENKKQEEHKVTVILCSIYFSKYSILCHW